MQDAIFTILAEGYFICHIGIKNTPTDAKKLKQLKDIIENNLGIKYDYDDDTYAKSIISDLNKMGYQAYIPNNIHVLEPW